jgi:hypothetical protein
MGDSERIAQAYLQICNKIAPFSPIALEQVRTILNSTSSPSEIFPTIAQSPKVPIPSRRASPIPIEPARSKDASHETNESKVEWLSVKVDLHGFNKMPARQYARRLAHNLEPISDSRIELIVGKGNHSLYLAKGGDSSSSQLLPLASAVVEGLGSMNWKVTRDNRGHIYAMRSRPETPGKLDSAQNAIPMAGKLNEAAKESAN